MAGELLKNQSSNGWIVQKFGGTSVGKFPDKIAEDIIRYGYFVSIYLFIFTSRSRIVGTTHSNLQVLNPYANHQYSFCRKYVETHKLVVVCSARSTGKKTNGTTSR